MDEDDDLDEDNRDPNVRRHRECHLPVSVHLPL